MTFGLPKTHILGTVLVAAAVYVALAKFGPAAIQPKPKA